MGYSTKVGSFNIDTTKTAGQTQAISGVGFTPKVVLFWWSGATDTGDGARGEDANIGFGAVSGASSRFSMSTSSNDESAACDPATRLSTFACIVSMLDGLSTIDGWADWGSFDSDGFTLTIDDQFSTALRVSYLALGGTDLTDVYIGSKTMPGSTGNYSVTGLGFQPDCLITAFGQTTLDSTAGSGNIAIGIATGSSNQGVVAGYMHNDFGTSLTAGYGYGGEVNASLSFSGGVFNRDTFVSFDAGGFTLNHLESTIPWDFVFIALKGGQYKVCSVTTATDTTPFSDTEAGFQPVALLLLSANRAQSTQDVSTNHWSMSIGAATSTTNRAAQAIWNENGLADTENATANYDTACYAYVKDDAIVGLMDISSIDATGVTFVMDDADPSACWVTYLAIGAAGGGATQLVVQDAAHAQVADNTALTQKQLLSIQDANHAQTVDNIVLPSGLITGPTAWGHITGVQEKNVQTFTGHWTGTGEITGSSDAESMLLGAAEYMESEVVITGDVLVTLLQNEYGSGDTATIKYRHGADEAACEAAAWNEYSTPFNSLGYVQVRMENVP